MVDLFYSPDYLYSGTSIDTTNKAAWVEASLAANPIPGVRIVDPGLWATSDMIGRVHSPDYTTAIWTGEPPKLANRNGVCEWTPDFSRSRLTSTGGVVRAALHAWQSGGVTGSMSSGLHHARHDHGSGYCTLNGLVIAAAELVHRGAKRVLIIDLDAHGGGGTASLIQHRPQIEQIDVSVDAFDGYDSTRNAQYWLTSGRNYLSTVGEALESVVDPESIDLVVYNAGVDPHEDCLTGGAGGVTTAVLQMRDEMVFAWARDRRLPVTFVFAGGYVGGRMDKTRLVELHRNTIQAATGMRAVGAACSMAID